MAHFSISSRARKLSFVNKFLGLWLLGKVSELHSLIYDSANTDCFCFTEKWLTESVADGMLDPESKEGRKRNITTVLLILRRFPNSSGAFYLTV